MKKKHIFLARVLSTPENLDNITKNMWYKF